MSCVKVISGMNFFLVSCHLLPKPDLIPPSLCSISVGWGEGAFFKKAAGKEREETKPACKGARLLQL